MTQALRDLIGEDRSPEGPQKKIYEWAQQRWENQGKPFSIDDVTHLIERSKQAAATTSERWRPMA